MPAAGRRDSWRSQRLLVAAVAAGWAAGSLLAWQVFGTGGYPIFFPPAGLSVAALLISSPRLWPWIIAAIVAVEMPIDIANGAGIVDAAGYAVANNLEPVVGATTVLALCGRRRPDLRGRADLARFIAGAVLAGPLVGAAVGAAVVAMTTGSVWQVEMPRWWAGDAIGVLVVAPTILLWSSQWRLLRERPVETTVVLVGAAALSVTSFWHVIPPSMTTLPLLIWAAVRLGVLGAALTGSVIAISVLVMAASGGVLFPALSSSPNGTTGITQAYLAFMTVVALVIAQEVEARLDAVRRGRSERRQRVRVESLAGLAQQLSAGLTPGDIGGTTAATVMKNVGAQALTLGLVNHDGDRLEWITMAGYPPEVAAEFASGLELSEPTVAAEVVRTGTPAILRDMPDYRDRYPTTARWITALEGSSFVAWPLTVGGRTVGVLNLLWGEPQPLDEAQVAYVSAVASMVGQALVRAQIYADENARAAVLQAAVSPEGPVDIPGLELAVDYQPADARHGLGGDWFDILPLPTGTYLAVGDVVGHGLPSVQDMAQLRTAGRALALQGLSASRILNGLNAFAKELTAGKFATMVIAIVDPHTGTLAYADAGHPPAMLRRRCSDEVIHLEDGHGPALGVCGGFVYSEARTAFDPGDILVLYTDGLVESRRRGIDAGIASAEKMLSEWPEHAALENCCREMVSVLAPAPRDDDVCVLAVRTLR